MNTKKSDLLASLMQAHILFFFICMFSNAQSQVQFPSPTGRNYPNTGDNLGQDSIDQEVLEDLPPDTIRIFTPHQLKNFRFFDDTSILHQFHQYDAVRMQNIPYLNIGNFGSPNRPALFHLFKRQGLDIGSHVLDVYKINYDDIEFYDSKRPFTFIRLAQKDFSQQDLQLQTKFFKTFQNGLHLVLDYSSLNYKGEFVEQINKTSKGTFGMWYHSPKGNYDFLITYLTNTSKLQDNGGITGVDSLFKIKEFRQDPFIISNNLITARSRQANQVFTIQNGFNIKIKESLVAFTHQSSLATNKYNYTDVDATTTADSVYYKNYYTKDTLHIELSTFGLINDFRLKGSIKESTELEVGLKHEWHRLDNTFSKSNLNLLFLHGQYKQEIGNNILLHGTGQWGILENIGEYHMRGMITLKKEKWGEISGHFTSQRSPIPIIFRQLYSRNKLLFASNLEKPLSNQLGGSIHIPSLQLKAGVDQSLVTNHIYLDSLRRPVQFKSSISITSLYAQKHLIFGSFRTYHNLTFQFNSQNNILRLPTWFSQNTIYYQKNVFKNNMFAQVGLDSRILPSFTTQSYFPLLGNFYNSNKSSSVPFHPYVELFFNFQLRNFRGFAKMEGLEYYLFKSNQVFYETYDQPLFRTNIRFGFSWILRD